MTKTFELIENTRTNVLKTLSNLTDEQLFTIPKPYNNHIFWNAAHLMATHQMLLYTFSGVAERIDGAFIKKYNKGTTPSEEAHIQDLSYLKDHFLQSLLQSREDYEKGYFGTYKPLTTSYGSNLNTLEDAVNYVNLHEAMHFGQIKMLERLLV